MQLIALTRAALKENVKRAIYMWKQFTIPMPVLPLPIQWGWSKSYTAGSERLWTTFLEEPKTCQDTFVSHSFNSFGGEVLHNRSYPIEL